jgi:hypothetical protein
MLEMSACPIGRDKPRARRTCALRLPLIPKVDSEVVPGVHEVYVTKAAET